MRRDAIIAAAIALAADGAYLALIHSQGATDGSLRVPFIASLIAVSGVCAMAAAVLRDSKARSLLLGFAGALMLVLGILALFDIGLLLIIAGVFVVLAIVRSARRQLRWRLSLTLIGAAAAVAVVIGGCQWTSYPVTCPVAGDASGSGTTFLGGSYTWTCHDGTVTVGHA